MSFRSFGIFFGVLRVLGVSKSFEIFWESWEFFESFEFLKSFLRVLGVFRSFESFFGVLSHIYKSFYSDLPLGPYDLTLARCLENFSTLWLLQAIN